ncbi:small secreted protein [Streptomyces sp. NPDC050704]|uniref:small secreted protein n=1 Tax=Streptomyces sp. NPDC050704 TaxID=3157219 RepID=UPI0034472B88
MEGTKPVNKKLAAALSGGAVLVLALSGCSDDGNEKLDSWAKEVCDAVPAQGAKIKAANDAITKTALGSNEPKTVQKTDSQAFQDLSDGYKALATAFDKAGAPPDVDDGAQNVQDVVKRLNDLSTSYAGLKKQTDTLDTKDQAKFADGLNDISTEMKKLEKQTQNVLVAEQKLQTGDVKKSIAKQESCKTGTAAATKS